MPSRFFPTPQDVETAFYEALERGDVEAMMEVWAEDDDIVCVHPAGPRLAGQDQVRAGWVAALAGGRAMRVHVSHEIRMAGTLVAVHSVHESFLVEGESSPRGPVIATNIYLRTPSGWRMAVHHASPMAGAMASPPSDDAAKLLH